MVQDLVPNMTPIIFAVLVAAIIGVVVKLPVVKGWWGEFVVHNLLAISLPKSKYVIFKDVLLPFEDGTTQIDHIVLSPAGIFVIETKNMKGWIFGNSRQKMWTQKIYRSNYKFQNPIRQNYKHLLALESTLEVPKEDMTSIVVFVGNSTFKTKRPSEVVKLGKLGGTIKGSVENRFTRREIEAMAQKIHGARLVGRKEARKHVQHLKEKFDD